MICSSITRRAPTRSRTRTSSDTCAGVRKEIIEFTANWRALSILEKVLPPALPDPAVERHILRRAQARLRAMRRRRRRGKPI